MSRCELITSMLAGWAAKELEPMERRIVADHLAECESCRAELAREMRLRKAVADMPLITCPDEVADAVSLAVADDEAAARRAERRSTARPRPVGPGGWRTWTATAAVAAAVLLVVLMPRSAGDGPAGGPGAANAAALAQARADVTWTLAFTARVIDRSEKRIMVDVLRRLRDEAFPEARELGNSTSTGGRG
jgi:anti-sigma factor RsiW